MSGPGASRVVAARPLHAPVLAALHAAGAAGRAWSAEETRSLLAAPGSFAFIAEEDGVPAGFVLARAAGDEAEILMLTVVPGSRRRGLASRLLKRAGRQAYGVGARVMLLEVAADNAPALALYAKGGFRRAGVRPGYYRRDGETPVDAVLMRWDLAGDPADRERGTL